MSQDPWAALEARRQRRNWRRWPWGWAALGFSIAAWGCLFLLTIVAMGSVGMPGDGDHAMRAAAPYLYFTLALSAAVLLGCLGSSVLAIVLRRQRAGGWAALALLAVLAAVILLPVLASRLVRDGGQMQLGLSSRACIWQAAGVQG